MISVIVVPSPSILGCNCTILYDPATHIAIIVDPSDVAYQIKEAIEQFDLQVDHILLTHAHVDHVVELELVYEYTGAPISLHPKDRFLYRIVPFQAILLGKFGLRVPKSTHQIVNGDTIPFGNSNVSVIHTPGHTKGSCCFYDGSVLIAGDTLMRETTGRTDMPGGSRKDLVSSIQNRLYTLPDKTRVISGHGPETTIGYEKRHNLIVRATPFDDL